jgi:hypothetical protein
MFPPFEVVEHKAVFTLHNLTPLKRNAVVLFTAELRSGSGDILKLIATPNDVLNAGRKLFPYAGRWRFYVVDISGILSVAWGFHPLGERADRLKRWRGPFAPCVSIRLSKQGLPIRFFASNPLNSSAVKGRPRQLSRSLRRFAFSDKDEV